MSQAPPPPPPPQTGQDLYDYEPPPKPESNSTAVILIVVFGVGGLLVVACGGLLLGIWLPAVSSAREVANRAVDASNLRGIADGMFAYAADHGDQWPPHVGLTIDGGYTSAEVFDSPLIDDPPGPPTYTGTAVLPVPNYRFGDYYFVYTGSRVSTMGIDGMVAIGPATEEGRNVVYGDGHVEWLAPAAFEAELQRANERRRKNDRTTPIDVYDLPIATP